MPLLQPTTQENGFLGDNTNQTATINIQIAKKVFRLREDEIIGRERSGNKGEIKSADVNDDNRRFPFLYLLENLWADDRVRTAVAVVGRAVAGRRGTGNRRAADAASHRADGRSTTAAGQTANRRAAERAHGGAGGDALLRLRLTLAAGKSHAQSNHDK
ncbi:hypothetical protein [Mongoliimonas terrestris]|uniref:hypothetical protein n=1 Tax=Mongoliimonas terrestris TaxID=1709001 RepID=UPI001587FF45|nr:hypothetical protein [Mongoliimonas terrestris]